MTVTTPLMATRAACPDDFVSSATPTALFKVVVSVVITVPDVSNFTNNVAVVPVAPALIVTFLEPLFPNVVAPKVSPSFAATVISPDAESNVSPDVPPEERVTAPAPLYAGDWM